MPRPTVFFVVVKNLSIKRNDPISNATQAFVLHRTMCSTWTAFVLLRGVCCLSMTIYVVCRLSIFHVGQCNTQHMRQWSMCVSVCVCLHLCLNDRGHFTTQLNAQQCKGREFTVCGRLDSSDTQQFWWNSFSCFVRWASRNQVNNLPTKPTILF